MSHILIVVRKHLLGQGEGRRVFLAVDKETNEQVGLKVIDCDSEDDAVVAMREAERGSQLRSPYLVRYSKFFKEFHPTEKRWRAILVMEYCRDGSLSDLLKRRLLQNKPLTPKVLPWPSTSSQLHRNFEISRLDRNEELQRSE